MEYKNLFKEQFFICLIIVLFSCNGQIKHNSIKVEAESIQSIDSNHNVLDTTSLLLASKDSLIQQNLFFFKEFQDLLRYKKHKILVDKYINFPIEGDIIFYYCYGEDVFEKGFDYYETKLDAPVFLKNFNTIFDSDIIKLILKVNIDELFTDENYQDSITTHENEKLIIQAKYNNEQYSLYLSYIDHKESINEHSVVYVFKKIDGKMKLYKIYGIG